jgi:hypothetical protein
MRGSLALTVVGVVTLCSGVGRDDVVRPLEVMGVCARGAVGVLVVGVHMRGVVSSPSEVAVGMGGG